MKIPIERGRLKDGKRRNACPDRAGSQRFWAMQSTPVADRFSCRKSPCGNGRGFRQTKTGRKPAKPDFPGAGNRKVRQRRKTGAALPAGRQSASGETTRVLCGCVPLQTFLGRFERIASRDGGRVSRCRGGFFRLFKGDGLRQINTPRVPARALSGWRLPVAGGRACRRRSVRPGSSSTTRRERLSGSPARGFRRALRGSGEGPFGRQGLESRYRPRKGPFAGREKTSASPSDGGVFIPDGFQAHPGFGKPEIGIAVHDAGDFAQNRPGRAAGRF